MLKRISGWAFMVMTALCLCVPAWAQGGSYAVQLAGGALLVDPDGNELTQRGEYGALYELYGLPDGLGLYAGEAAVGESAGYALVNAQGEAMTEFAYQSLEYDKGWILFRQGGRMGAMDAEGGVILEPVYTALAATGSGGWLAQKTDPYDDSPDMVYLVDEDGTERETGLRIASGLGTVSGGLCPAVSADNGRIGYIGVDGTWAIEPQYEWADAFSGGFAVASTASGTGLLAADGRWAIGPKYEYLSYEAGGLAVCGAGDTLELVDAESGSTVAVYREAGVYGYSSPGGMAVVMLGGRAVAVDRTGREILSLEACRTFSQWVGMTEHAVAYMGGFGQPGAYLYRMDGNCLAGPYQDVMPLGMMDGQMYYMYTQFETVETVYPDLGVSLWDEVPGTRRCGVLSPDGETLCELAAAYITYLGEDRVLIEQEGGAMMANFSGGMIKQFEAFGAEDEKE